MDMENRHFYSIWSLIILLGMREGKYHTIDPLILDQLNLNQQRMKHILEILHGNQRPTFAKTHRKTLGAYYFRNESLGTVTSQDSLLPQIIQAKRQEAQRSKETTFFTPASDKKSSRLIRDSIVNHSMNTKGWPQKAQNPQRNRARYELGPRSQRLMKHERSAEEDIINLQQQILSLQRDKKQQLMKDYMVGKLRRSKSQEINPKDLYRLQIQAIVSELTPIEHLQQAQVRMRRLKRKHRHLSTFDKNYYMKLNQHDMIILF